MSLIDLGKNDISEETQALKDRLASQDTENAGLRTQLMRREAELEELQATLNETVYKLSKEAERALQLEEDVSARCSDLKTERISLRNSELALQSTQEKLKAEERAKRELEATLDTISLHSQATSTEHQSVTREKRVLESRVRELERIVQTHEAKGVSNISRKNGRPRSSSVSNFRLPAVEQELNDTKAQLHTKDKSLRALEQKLTQAQDDLVKAENARISIDKAGQKRISELLSTLEKKEEELELLRETDDTGEREEELLKRIDEDTAKIAALEKLVTEGQAARTSQARAQKLQSQLKAECEKVQHSEDLRNQLLREKEELAKRYEASQWEIEECHRLLAVREGHITNLDARLTCLLAKFDAYPHCEEPLPLGAEPVLSQHPRPNGVPTFSEECALADHIQTLLQAIDRLRSERDELKRALEFSEVEYRITMEGFQTRIASLTGQLTGSTDGCAMSKPLANISVERRMKQLTSCAAAFALVISNMQTHLDLSESRLSAASIDLTSSNSRLHDTLAVIEGQQQSLETKAHEYDVLHHKLDAVTKELWVSEKERDCLCHQLIDVKGQIASTVENANASEAAREEAQQSLLSNEQRFATLIKSCDDAESERNSLALQVTNLEDDLARVQDELLEARNRYNALHAQRLSSISTTEVVQAHKDRIQELEAHLTQRTDQISEYQHDIRKLEANAKLHEERLAEMTSEVELLASEKEAMVEDCAGVREARDEAAERLEAAEDEVEDLQRQLQEMKHAHEAELSTMSSTVVSLTSASQQTCAQMADLEAQNAHFVRQLDSLRHDHQRLIEESNLAASRSQSLQLENSNTNADVRQAVVSLALVCRSYKDSARRLQKSHQYIISLESQLVTLGMRAESQQRAVQHGHDVDALRSLLEKKEQELVTARQLLEETLSHLAEAKAELQERITTTVMAQEEQADDASDLQAQLKNVQMQLQNSLENFADLEKVHADVMQEFTAAKEIFECQLSETDAQIHSLDADHQRSLGTLEAKLRHETDILSSNLEDREREVNELRQQLRDLSEAHSRVEGKLHDDLRSHEARQTFMNDLEKNLRQTIADACQQLAQAEEETLTLQEERQLLQAQITGLQAEIQRSTSFTRYLEGQVRENEDACVLMKESLQRVELALAESEKVGKAAEFNLTLQATQHEKVIVALRREIASLRSGLELRSVVADLEEKNREMDDLLRAKCQEIEEYDDRILEALKANKKLTSKVESLTRKIQALQTKLSLMKTQPQETTPPQLSSTLTPPIPAPAAGNYSCSSRIQETSTSLTPRSETPEPQVQSVLAPLSSHTPRRIGEPLECKVSTGKKRPAPDDDERDSVPAEGHYSMDGYLRNGPTPRLRRAHGHPASFTPVRGASLRKLAGPPSPGRRVNPSDVITDVTNSPRGPSGQGTQLKKRSWLGKVRSGTGSQPASSRPGAFGGQ